MQDLAAILKGLKTNPFINQIGYPQQSTATADVQVPETNNNYKMQQPAGPRFKFGGSSSNNSAGLGGFFGGSDSGGEKKMDVKKMMQILQMSGMA